MNGIGSAVTLWIWLNTYTHTYGSIHTYVCVYVLSYMCVYYRRINWRTQWMAPALQLYCEYGSIHTHTYVCTYHHTCVCTIVWIWFDSRLCTCVCIIICVYVLSKEYIDVRNEWRWFCSYIVNMVQCVCLCVSVCLCLCLCVFVCPTNGAGLASNKLMFLS
jgi:hypothetical protein